MMKMKRLIPILALLIVAGCGGGDDPTVGPTPTPTTSAPYSQTDLVVGTGATAAPGNQVTVAYTGWLHDSSKPDAKGTQFDSNTISFRLGTGQVIRGWDQGVPGMRVGGQRRLVIPPDLAYGNSSPGAGIPPNATLVFDITLNNVQ
jgi:FKBP-type peptidyl-prolyl cis-trans isomerase FkpA